MEIVKNKHEEESLTARIEAFLLKYRVVLLSIIGIIFAAAVAIGIFFAVTESVHTKGLNRVDEISTALVSASEDDYADAVEQALSRLEPLTSSKNIVGARANMLKAEILFEDKKFEQARDAWLKAADASAKSYIAPLSWFNAAACSEELNDPDTAFTYYQKAAAEKDWTLKTHSLFNAGRVKDEGGAFEEAAKIYQELNDSYSGDSWANIAMTRLLALRAEGKIQ